MYDKVLEINPNFKEVYYKIGLNYLHKTYYNKANCLFELKMYEQAVAMYDKAVTYIKLDPQKKLAMMDKIIQLDPYCKGVYYYKGNFLIEL